MTLKQLVERLNYHRELYYNGVVNDPPQWLEGEISISDDEFDYIVEAIKTLDPTNPAILSVGSVTGGDVKHLHRMGSLAKIKTMKEFKEWFDKYANTSKTVWALPKYDGTSLDLQYEAQALSNAATRGNGEVGVGVLPNAKVVNGVQRSINSFYGTKNVRGEVIMPFSVFKRLNANGQDLKNVRNAAAGSLKQDDPTITASRDLSFYAYDLIDDSEFNTYGEVLSALSGYGFDVGDLQRFIVNGNDFSEIEAYLTDFNQARKYFDFATDGVVFILDSIEDQKNAGWSSNQHHPNGKIAFKFDPEAKDAEIIGYTLQVGKTGKIIPVAELNPVDLDGSTVTNVTLHNYGNMITKGLMSGAKIRLVKANDVIPYVQSVISPSPLVLSKTPVCPSCGSETSFDGVNLWCPNEDCSARLESKILHFLTITDCLGIGDKTVAKLIESGLVKGLQDLLDDKMTVANIAKALGSSSSNSREAEVVYEALQGIRNLPFNLFIESLGISKVGSNTSKKLASYYKNVNDLVEFVSYSTLIGFEDVGDKTANSIVDNLRKRKEEILFLASKIGIVIKKSSSNKLDGKTFLFTGTLSKSRKHFEDMVEENGGKLVGSVSKKLQYLVVGEDSGSKLSKSQALGIPTLTEVEFLKMVGD